MQTTVEIALGSSKNQIQHSFTVREKWVKALRAIITADIADGKQNIKATERSLKAFHQQGVLETLRSHSLGVSEMMKVQSLIKKYRVGERNLEIALATYDTAQKGIISFSRFDAAINTLSFRRARRREIANWEIVKQSFRDEGPENSIEDFVNYRAFILACYSDLSSTQTTKAKLTTVEVGARVEVRMNDKAQWQRATVQKINNEGHNLSTYTVRILSSDTVHKQVQIGQIRQITTSHPHRLRQSNHVLYQPAPPPASDYFEQYPAMLHAALVLGSEIQSPENGAPVYIHICIRSGFS